MAAQFRKCQQKMIITITKIIHYENYSDQLEYKFIEDYVSDNGEYAYTLTVEKRKQKNNE